MLMRSSSLAYLLCKFLKMEYTILYKERLLAMATTAEGAS